MKPQEPQICATQTPLQLEYSIFPVAKIQAYPYEAEMETKEPIIEEATPFVSQMDEEGRRWSVLLKISSNKKTNDEPIQFSYEFEAFGVFRWEGEMPDTEEEKRRLGEIIAISGASILFGGCREYLSFMTSKTPYLNYLLPTLRFVPRNTLPEED